MHIWYKVDLTTPTTGDDSLESLRDELNRFSSIDLVTARKCRGYTEYTVFATQKAVVEQLAPLVTTFSLTGAIYRLMNGNYSVLSTTAPHAFDPDEVKEVVAAVENADPQIHAAPVRWSILQNRHASGRRVYNHEPQQDHVRLIGTEGDDEMRGVTVHLSELGEMMLKAEFTHHNQNDSRWIVVSAQDTRSLLKSDLRLKLWVTAIDKNTPVDEGHSQISFDMSNSSASIEFPAFSGTRYVTLLREELRTAIRVLQYGQQAKKFKPKPIVTVMYSEIGKQWCLLRKPKTAGSLPGWLEPDFNYEFYGGPILGRNVGKGWEYADAQYYDGITYADLATMIRVAKKMEPLYQIQVQGPCVVAEIRRRAHCGRDIVPDPQADPVEVLRYNPVIVRVLPENII